MTLADKRKIVNLVVFLAILLGGYGIYNKNINLIIICFIVAVALASFEEKIIRWL